MTSSFEKLSISLRYYLQGKGYYKAMEAYALAREYHTGTRKDKITPELQHPVEVALHAITLKDLVDEEGTIITCLPHDLTEDYNVSQVELIRRFGSDVADSIVACDKTHKSAVHYFDVISADPRASIAKGCDRVHNFQSMPGVFSDDKQKSYLAEGRTYFLPMLKKAAYNFPQQQLAYMNVRQVMKRQMQLLELSHARIDGYKAAQESVSKADEIIRGAEEHAAHLRHLAGIETTANTTMGVLLQQAELLPELLKDKYPNQRYMLKDIFRDGLRVLRESVIEVMKK